METIRDIHDDGELLMTSDAADILGVVPVRVIQLCDKRKIPHVLTPKGRRIFLRRDVEAFKAARAAR